jgi:hypothetical protein
MQRTVIFVVAVVAAVWAKASVAQPPSPNSRGEAWASANEPARGSFATKTKDLARPGSDNLDPVSPTGTRWPAGSEGPRFGSGLEDDAPIRAPNVFLQSGMEGLTSTRRNQSSTAVVRYGSGLEDDAPIRSSTPLYQSGLDNSSTARATLLRVVTRFGSGLEKDAPAREPSVFHQSGF